MDATQPLAQDLARLVGPFDLASSTAHQDFLYWWRRGAKLLRLPQLQPRPGPSLGSPRDRGRPAAADAESAARPGRAPPGAAANDARPGRVQALGWLHQEAGLEFGQLAACRLGHDVFQVMVGLLANHRETPNH